MRTLLQYLILVMLSCRMPLRTPVMILLKTQVMILLRTLVTRILTPAIRTLIKDQVTLRKLKTLPLIQTK